MNTTRQKIVSVSHLDWLMILPEHLVVKGACPSVSETHRSSAHIRSLRSAGCAPVNGPEGLHFPQAMRAVDPAVGAINTTHRGVSDA